MEFLLLPTACLCFPVRPHRIGRVVLLRCWQRTEMDVLGELDRKDPLLCKQPCTLFS